MRVGEGKIRKELRGNFKNLGKRWELWQTTPRVTFNDPCLLVSKPLDNPLLCLGSVCFQPIENGQDDGMPLPWLSCLHLACKASGKICSYWLTSTRYIWEALGSEINRRFWITNGSLLQKTEVLVMQPQGNRFWQSPIGTLKLAFPQSHLRWDCRLDQHLDWTLRKYNSKPENKTTPSKTTPRLLTHKLWDDKCTNILICCFKLWMYGHLLCSTEN